MGTEKEEELNLKLFWVILVDHEWVSGCDGKIVRRHWKKDTALNHQGGEKVNPGGWGGEEGLEDKLLPTFLHRLWI